MASFEEVLPEIKAGKKAYRTGWNGKGMYIYLQNESDMGKKKINPHIDMKAADDSIVIGWMASQTDMLADDWWYF